MEWIITSEVGERNKERRRLIVIDKLTKKHKIVLTVAIFDAVKNINFKFYHN